MYLSTPTACYFQDLSVESFINKYIYIKNKQCLQIQQTGVIPRNPVRLDRGFLELVSAESLPRESFALPSWDIRLRNENPFLPWDISVSWLVRSMSDLIGALDSALWLAVAWLSLGVAPK